MDTLRKWLASYLAALLAFQLERWKLELGILKHSFKNYRRLDYWTGFKVWQVKSALGLAYFKIKYERDPFIVLKLVFWFHIAMSTLSNPAGVAREVFKFALTPSILAFIGIWLVVRFLLHSPMWWWKVEKRLLSVYFSPMCKRGDMDLPSFLANLVVRVINVAAMVKLTHLVSAGMDPRMGEIVEKLFQNRLFLAFVILSFELYVAVPIYHYFDGLDYGWVKKQLKKHQWKIALLSANIGFLVMFFVMPLFPKSEPEPVVVDVPAAVVPAHTTTVIQPAVFTQTDLLWVIGILVLVAVVWIFHEKILEAFSDLVGKTFDGIGTVTGWIGSVLNSDKFWKGAFRLWTAIPSVVGVWFLIVVWIIGWGDVKRAEAASVEHAPIATSSPSPVPATFTPAPSATLTLNAPTQTSTVAFTPTIVFTPTFTVTATETPSATFTATLTEMPTAVSGCNLALEQLSGTLNMDQTTWTDNNGRSSYQTIAIILDSGELCLISNSATFVTSGEDSFALAQLAPIEGYTGCTGNVNGAGSYTWKSCYVYLVGASKVNPPSLINSWLLNEVARVNDSPVFQVP